jgi:hypothetical protein
MKITIARSQLKWPDLMSEVIIANTCGYSRYSLTSQDSEESKGKLID